MHKCRDVVVQDYRTEKLWSLLAKRPAHPPPLLLRWIDRLRAAWVGQSPGLEHVCVIHWKGWSLCHLRQDAWAP